jgi:flagellar assembly factor FliW
MRLLTSRFGEINYSAKEIITFSEGILGLENLTRYLIIKPPESKPFLWLQSLDDPQAALPVIHPEIIVPDYPVELSDDLKRELEIKKGDQIEIFCIVHLEKDWKASTVNLLTPVVVNHSSCKAKQVIQDKKPYTSRHNLLELLTKAKG